MELFHVSCKQYPIGYTLDALDFERTEYHANAESIGKAWIDDSLDASRPQGQYPKRSKTLFAFKFISHCAAFADNRCEKPIYYRVEMANPVACPMCLLSFMKKDNDLLNNRIAHEYWTPTLNWDVFEYLDTQMKILNIFDASAPFLAASGMMNYMDDYHLAQARFT